MSTAKFIELFENIPVMKQPSKREERINKWVAWQLQNLRRTYCAAHDIDMDEYAKRVRVSKKRLYELEDESPVKRDKKGKVVLDVDGKPIKKIKGSVKVDTLNSILEATDTSLAEFFSKRLTYEKVDDIRDATKKDIKKIEVLIRALSHPDARRFVEIAYEGASDWVGSEDDAEAVAPTLSRN